jgi:hypothetical protein
MGGFNFVSGASLAALEEQIEGEALVLVSVTSGV